MSVTAYQGNPDSPLPPVAEDGWTVIDSPDHPHFEPAMKYAASGTVGSLPANHYADMHTPTGLYRFFHYQSPNGGQIGALHYDGQIHGGDFDALGTASGRGGELLGDTSSPPGLIGAGAGADSVTQLSNAGGGLADGNGDQYSLGGSSGHEPIPQNTASCTWVPDATNSAAVAMANNISYHNTPIAFQDQAVYNVTIAGAQWKMVMWAGDCVGDGGTYHCVSTFRCEPGAGPTPPNPSPTPAASSSSGTIWFVILTVLGLGGTAVAVASKKKHA